MSSAVCLNYVSFFRTAEFLGAAISRAERLVAMWRTGARDSCCGKATHRDATVTPRLGPPPAWRSPSPLGCITNALAEEVFWRGLPVAIQPGDPIFGRLWRAVGFTAWHVVPLQAAGAERHRWSAVLLGAGLMGLGNSWIAQRTHHFVMFCTATPLPIPAASNRRALDGWTATTAIRDDVTLDVQEQAFPRRGADDTIVTDRTRRNYVRT
jgi:Type II CAAX prenyl endopeptidase Rce1-like